MMNQTNVETFLIDSGHSFIHLLTSTKSPRFFHPQYQASKKSEWIILNIVYTRIIFSTMPSNNRQKHGNNSNSFSLLWKAKIQDDKTYIINNRWFWSSHVKTSVYTNTHNIQNSCLSSLQWLLKASIHMPKYPCTISQKHGVCVLGLALKS